MVRQRVRIRFTKQGDLRLIGHLDLMRSLERLFRRAELPLGMSEGFHPKPRMAFPLALAVGIAGSDEIVELELTEPFTAEQVAARLASHGLPGLEFTSLEVLPLGAKKARVGSVRYEAAVPPQYRASLAEEIARLCSSDCCTVTRPGRERPIDLCGQLEELTLHDGVLSMRLRIGSQGSAGPRDVLRALGLEDLELQGACLRRTAVEIGP